MRILITYFVTNINQVSNFLNDSLCLLENFVIKITYYASIINHNRAYHKCFRIINDVT